MSTNGSSGDFVDKLLFSLRTVYSSFRSDNRLDVGGRDGTVNVIDIGAARGLPAPLNDHHESIRYLLRFEPLEEDYEDSFITARDTVLWENECERQFYVNKGRKARHLIERLGDNGGSLLVQNYEYVSRNYPELRQRGPQDLAEQWFERAVLEDIRTVQCRTLDDVLAETDIDEPFHLLKVDAQGADYNIMKGATDYLTDECVAINTELFTIPLYRDVALFDEVVDYLEGFGFELAKKHTAHGTFNSQHDCLFLKESADDEIRREIEQIYSLAN